MLRHRPGVFDDAWVDRKAEPSKMLPKLQQPYPVMYQRDAKLGPLMSVLREHRYVLLKAGVGAGKSSVIPEAVAKHFGMLVVHTIPFIVTAAFCAQYQQSLGRDVHFCDDAEADFPDRGVLLTSTAILVAKLGNMASKGETVKPFILYMDENHESDAWTAALRMMALQLSCVEKLVLASATHDPKDNLRVVIPGKVVDHEYEYRPVSQWTVEDKGQPWHHAAIQKNTIIAIDCAASRQRLAEEYEAHGFKVRILADRPSVPTVGKVFAELVDKRSSGIMIVMVDYAFRSGLTILGVGVGIDSGECVRHSVDNGRLVSVMRRAYKGEIIQFLGRFGRVEGETVHRYFPSGAMNAVCDMEPLEADAVAVILRMFGFRVPISLGDTPMAEGPVPCDMPAALSGTTPLCMYRGENVRPWVTGQQGVQPRNAVDVQEFEYAARGPVGRAVSCRTVPDAALRKSSYPALPRRTSVERVDSDALSDVMESVATLSRRASTVFTVDTDEVNHSNVYTSGIPLYEKPKRVAQRIIQKRSEEQLKQLRDMPALVDLSPPVDLSVAVASDVGPLTGEVSALRVEGVKGFGSGLDAVAQLQAKSRVAADRVKFTPDSMVDVPYYHHEVEKVGDYSSVFPRGFDSVVKFLEDDSIGIVRARALPSEERLFAVKVVLDRYNHQVSRIWGLTRLVHELMSRYDGEIEFMVDPGGFAEAVERVNSDKIKATVDLKVCRSCLLPFVTSSLVPIERMEKLEQDYMQEYMTLIEGKCVKREPDKQVTYARAMNSAGTRTVTAPSSFRLLK